VSQLGLDRKGANAEGGMQRSDLAPGGIPGSGKEIVGPAALYPANIRGDRRCRHPDVSQPPMWATCLAGKLMAKSRQPEKPSEHPRLTDRQWTVLGSVVQGKSVAPEQGKRIDLTLNSLFNRGLIEKVEVPDKPTEYRATTAGRSAFELHSKPAESKPHEAEKQKKVAAAVSSSKKKGIARKASGVRKLDFEVDADLEEQFVPRKGQLVWRRDGAGRRDGAYYRVVAVRVIDAKLETRSGNSWLPVPAWQNFKVLDPLTDAERATAKKAGVDGG
jgi:hypothetical protein